jgi:hypothetical protein
LPITPAANTSYENAVLAGVSIQGFEPTKFAAKDEIRQNIGSLPQ